MRVFALIDDRAGAADQHEEERREEG